MVKKLPAMQETWVQSLGWEDPSEEGHGNPLQYSCLENLTVGLAGYSPRGGKELDMTNSFSFHQASDGKETACNAETWVQSLGWEDPSEEGHGNPLQYSCLENLTVGLAGYSPWGGKELDMTNSFSFHQLSVLTLADFPFPGVGKEMTGVRRRRRKK